MTTRAEVNAAEAEALAHLRDVRNPEREGWVCADCDNADDADYPYGIEPTVEEVRWLWYDDDGSGTPLCRFHAEERVHDAIPYGANCSRCGKDHSALWPEGEPLFEEVPR
jgi:hypothetical protein